MDNKNKKTNLEYEKNIIVTEDRHTLYYFQTSSLFGSQGRACRVRGEVGFSNRLLHFWYSILWYAKKIVQVISLNLARLLPCCIIVLKLNLL